MPFNNISHYFHIHYLRQSSMIFRASSRILRARFSTYSNQMYDAWKTDPSSVHPTWNQYFKES